MNKFKEKEYECKYLSQLYRMLEESESTLKTIYKVIGESDEQAVDYRTGELQWKDEEKTIPKMKSIWGDVELSEDELSNEQLAELKAIRNVKAKLEKML